MTEKTNRELDELSLAQVSGGTGSETEDSVSISKEDITNGKGDHHNTVPTAFTHSTMIPKKLEIRTSGHNRKGTVS